MNNNDSGRVGVIADLPMPHQYAEARIRVFGDMLAEWKQKASKMTSATVAVVGWLGCGRNLCRWRRKGGCGDRNEASAGSCPGWVFRARGGWSGRARRPSIGRPSWSQWSLTAVGTVAARVPFAVDVILRTGKYRGYFFIRRRIVEPAGRRRQRRRRWQDQFGENGGTTNRSIGRPTHTASRKKTKPLEDARNVAESDRSPPSASRKIRPTPTDQQARLIVDLPSKTA